MKKVIISILSVFIFILGVNSVKADTNTNLTNTFVVGYMAFDLNEVELTTADIEKAILLYQTTYPEATEVPIYFVGMDIKDTEVLYVYSKDVDGNITTSLGDLEAIADVNKNADLGYYEDMDSYVSLTIAADLNNAGALYEEEDSENGNYVIEIGYELTEDGYVFDTTVLEKLLGTLRLAFQEENEDGEVEEVDYVLGAAIDINDSRITFLVAQDDYDASEIISIDEDGKYVYLMPDEIETSIAKLKDELTTLLAKETEEEVQDLELEIYYVELDGCVDELGNECDAYEYPVIVRLNDNTDTEAEGDASDKEEEVIDSEESEEETEETHSEEQTEEENLED